MCLSKQSKMLTAEERTDYINQTTSTTKTNIKFLRSVIGSVLCAAEFERVVQLHHRSMYVCLPIGMLQYADVGRERRHI